MGELADRMGLKLLHCLPAETAHAAGIAVLRRNLVHGSAVEDPVLSQNFLGKTFANPVGLAAGFDKNAEIAGNLLQCGFGFVEVGTLTPRPQAGNPKPRLFRLPADGAIINRMGFNNCGFEAARWHLEEAGYGRDKTPFAGVLGVNVGANRASRDRIDDYCQGFETFAPLADYVAINISSPNTPRLRDFHGKTALRTLLARVQALRRQVENREARACPLVLKISPDLDDDALKSVIEAVQEYAVDGIIVTNTSVARAPLRDRFHRNQAGGLSGRPLFVPSTRTLAKIRHWAGPDLMLIGVGGIDSGKRALTKIEAGANLVQLYTGLVYKGMGLVGEINRFLAAYVRAQGLNSITDLSGKKCTAWIDA